VDQQVGDLFEFADIGEIENVVAAIGKIITRTANGTQRSIACSDAGERN